MDYVYRPKNFKGTSTPTTRYILGANTRSRRPIIHMQKYRIPWRSLSLILVGAILLGGIGVGGYNVRNYMLDKNDQKMQAQRQAEEAENAKRISELKSKIQNGTDAMKLGRQKQEEGSLKEAEVAYTLALQYQPNWRDAYLSLGQVQIALKEYSSAELSLDRAQAIDPVYPTTQTLLSVLYQKTGRKQQATTAENKAQELAKRLGLEIGG